MKWIWWHRHRWGLWSEPREDSIRRRLFWQERRCETCNKAQRRKGRGE